LDSLLQKDGDSNMNVLKEGEQAVPREEIRFKGTIS